MRDDDIEERLAALRADGFGPGERAAIVDRYGDGDCLVLAFAIHWMTGFPVEAVSDGDRGAILHFAAFGVVHPISTSNNP